MKTHSVKLPPGLRAVPVASLRSRFYAYRSAVLAVASIGALRAAATLDDRDAARRLRSLVSERSAAMQDSTADSDAFTLSSPLAAAEETAPASHGLSLGGDLLTPSERAAIASVRPGALSVVFRSAPVAAPEVADLPPGFVAAPVADYVSISPARDAAIETEAAREAAAEIAAIEADETREALSFAAVSFDSQPFAGIPSDYSPDGTHGKTRAAPIMRARFVPYVPARAPAARPIIHASPSSDAGLLAAVLAKAAARKG